MIGKKFIPVVDLDELEQKVKLLLGREENQPDFVDVHIGNKLRICRKEYRMTQQDLGKILGITFQQVQKYEKGVNRVSASKLYYLALIFGKNTSYFYEGLPNNMKDALNMNSLNDSINEEDAPNKEITNILGSMDRDMKDKFVAFMRDFVRPK